jgi:hypothetical protein
VRLSEWRAVPHAAPPERLAQPERLAWPNSSACGIPSAPARLCRWYGQGHVAPTYRLQRIVGSFEAPLLSTGRRPCARSLFRFIQRRPLQRYVFRCYVASFVIVRGDMSMVIYRADNPIDLSCHRPIVPSTYRAIDLSCHRPIVPSTYRAIDLSCHRPIVPSTYRAWVPIAIGTIEGIARAR